MNIKGRRNLIFYCTKPSVSFSEYKGKIKEDVINKDKRTIILSIIVNLQFPKCKNYFRKKRKKEVMSSIRKN